MSLGLVSYDDSEESDNEEDSEITLTENNKLSGENIKSAGIAKETSKATSSKWGETSGHISDEEVETNADLEKAVHFSLPESKLSTLNTDIDIKCLTSASSRAGPVRITIPALVEFEEDAEQPSKKKLKPSQKGSGLFALLPSPKSSLVPQSVVKRNHSISVKKTNAEGIKITKPAPKVTAAPVVDKPSLITYEDSGDEDEGSGTIDFFSLESQEDEVTPAPIDVILPEVGKPIPPPPPRDVGSSSWSASTSDTPAPSAEEYPTSAFMSFSQDNLQLDQEAMQQLCGRRDRRNLQEVSLIDVSGDAIMPDSREWLTKQLTEETSHRSGHKKRDGPTTQQKRKHQITYLAFQAKENELELKNQWANNRMSRKQTQAKYGF